MYSESEISTEWGHQYLNAEISLPTEDKMTRDCMVHPKNDANGYLVGRSNNNPILNTCLCKVEVSGGEITELEANIIANSMYAQCFVDRNKYPLLEVLMEHRKNDLYLSVEHQKVVVKGRETLTKSTAGWDVCCKWKDGSTSWKKLSNLKESHPIELLNMP